MKAKLLGGLTLLGIAASVVGAQILTSKGDADKIKALSAVTVPVVLIGSIGTIATLRSGMYKKYGKDWKKETEVPGSYAARHPILSFLFPIIPAVGGISSEM